MLRNLYGVLLRMDLEHHKLYGLQEELIYLTATSLDPEGIDEAIRIKQLADSFSMHTIWDGENIQIRRNNQ